MTLVGTVQNLDLVGRANHWGVVGDGPITGVTNMAPLDGAARFVVRAGQQREWDEVNSHSDNIT